MKRIRFPDGSENVILLEDEKTGAKFLAKRPTKDQLMWISTGKYEIVEELTLEEIEKRVKEIEKKVEKEIEKESEENNYDQ
ncbi:hypothetical protein [Archaeoglobus sulfaticallidus]|nr:hypothetical protein [Archaeoglobus sulfaticallidus]